MPQWTTAEIVVESLKRHGIDTLYCLPGVQNDDFFDALKRDGSIRPLHARHEQGAAYMALGAALATGKPQAYCVVPGPGFLNTTAALSTAYGDNAPVLALTGQIPSGALGRNLGMLHEIPDQRGVMDGLTKWSAHISAPEQADAIMSEAFRRMLSGCPRPLAVECPVDVWGRATNQATDQAPAFDTAVPAPVTPDADAIEAAARLLEKARKPLIVVGGGAQHAGAEVLRVAERLQAPVACFRNGHGAIDERHPLSLTMPGAHRLWPEVDVVLGVGTRLQPPRMAWGLDENIKVICLDVDAARMRYAGRVDVALLGDSKAGMAALDAALAARNVRKRSRLGEMKRLKRTLAADFKAAVGPQVAYLKAIREALPDDGIFVDELTQLGYVARFAYPAHAPRTFLSTGYQGTLGWGVGAALGAKAACPEKAVVLVSGDGGFLFNLPELATAAHHGLAPVFVVFRDDAYGNVKRMQQENYAGRTIASDLTNPDFVKLAKTFGLDGARVRTPGALKSRIRKAIESQVATVIEVPVGPLPSPWDFVNFGKARG